MINKTEKEIMKNWVGDINNPLVSIRCITYNHEMYISEALDGFLIQETNFPFEVIVHDDASTDNTATIIKEYENKYPNIIKPIYEKENQYSKHDGSMSKIINRKIKGKYVAFCEGDDYWIDKNKLQLQTDYFILHPRCSLILTNNYSEDAETKKRLISNPYNETGILAPSEVIMENGALPATCSMMVPFKLLQSMPSLFINAPVGDRPLRLYAITFGYAFYFNETTCIYRKNSIGSFTQRTMENKNYTKTLFEKMIAFYNNYNKYTNYYYNSPIKYAIERDKYTYYIQNKKRIRIIFTNYFINNLSLKTKLRYIIGLLIPNKIKRVLKRNIK